MEDYYAILEVLPSATQEEIKTSYRRLALILHPDKNKAPNATARFQQLGRAWEELKDDIKRAAYDSRYKKKFTPWNDGHANFTSRPKQTEILRAQKIQMWKETELRLYKYRVELNFHKPWSHWSQTKRSLNFNINELRRQQEESDLINIPKLEDRMEEVARYRSNVGLESSESMLTSIVKSEDWWLEHDYFMRKWAREEQELHNERAKANEELFGMREEMEIHQNDARFWMAQEALEFLQPGQGDDSVCDEIKSCARQSWISLDNIKLPKNFDSDCGSPWHVETGALQHWGQYNVCGRCNRVGYTLNYPYRRCGRCNMILCGECDGNLKLLREYEAWLHGETVPGCQFDV